VLQRLKADPGLRTVPVVMLTSSREEQDLVHSYHLGVNAYVVKPVDFTEFVSALNQLGCFWAIVNQPPPGSVPRLS
jgi:CheY-like chemotaxis protein